MITKRKGTDVRDTRDLRNRLALIRSGEQVTLTYLRGSDTKAAKLETGLEIRVPLFVKEGEKVKVHTETREFAGRA